MLHNEHLRKADETYEVRHDDNGNAIHIIIKDGSAVVYSELNDLIKHQYFGKDTERFYVAEADLDSLYNSRYYNYYILKKLWIGEEEQD